MTECHTTFSQEWIDYIKSLKEKPILEKTNKMYSHVSHCITKEEWHEISYILQEIIRYKEDMNAVIVAHNYMTPDIFFTIADYRGDSLEIARMASTCDADIIIQAGVYFMAETTKILSPHKTVLHPDKTSGCSLSESITGKDVINMRKKYPGIPVVTYVNTSAEVKAESDICCTSSNAEKIVRSLSHERIILIPDKYLAQNVANSTGKEIISWEKGKCQVHDLFSSQDIEDIRSVYDDVTIIAHPECKPDVVKSSDFSGSTSQMINYIQSNPSKNVMLLTECSMGSNISNAANVMDKNIIKPCHLCPHMQKITLEKILYSLRYQRYRVEIDSHIILEAQKSLHRMLEFI